LALAVPLSRFTSRVGGGSAFYVRHHYTQQKHKTTKHIFMTRYFIAANIWLIFGVVGMLGRNHKTMGFSAFLNGPEMDASIYSLIVFGLFAVSAFFFVLTWKTCKKS
jgi:hypothetical protein